MAKSGLLKGSLHVALAPPHLHGIPTRVWNLRPWPHMHNPRHIEVGKKPTHTLWLHTGGPLDGGQLTP